MWKKLLDGVYDAAICGFSVIDIFCDVFVTLQFYRTGHSIFFGISCFILLLAQISYAIVMCLALDPVLDRKWDSASYQKRESERTRRYLLLFLCVLPFGQLVPLYLMIANAFPQTFNSVYKRLGWKNALNDVEQNLFYVQDGTQPPPKRKTKRRRYPRRSKGLLPLKKRDLLDSNEQDESDSSDEDRDQSDPLSVYIRHKLMSHLGFIVEALIEAIPQSILQMIFLIMYSESVSIINLISIFMSMMVVVSKGTLLSYSIYRSAAIFNFLCFALDIFGIFCVCSWLFCTDPNETVQNDDGEAYQMYGYVMWSSSYYYFSILRRIIKCAITGGVAVICIAVHDSYRGQSNHPWRRWTDIVLATLVASLLFFPVAIICLMIRFTLLPLLVLRVFDHSQNKSFAFYNQMFTFLTSCSSISEMHEKLLLSHWIFANIVESSGSDLATYHSYEYGLRYSCSKIVQHYKQNDGSISLSVIYRKLGYLGLAKYHQIWEILTLLFSRKGVWAFLFIKVMFVLRLHSEFLVKAFYHALRLCYVPLDIDDISFLWESDRDGVSDQRKFDQLETEFWSTVQEIQAIVNWKRFTQRVREIIDDFLNTDYKEKWRRFKANVLRDWASFRNKYTNEYIQTQTLYALRWFFYHGLYMAIKQDMLNVYNEVQRRLQVESKQTGSSSKRSCSRRGQQHKVKYENQYISRWNLPRCWSSFKIMFGDQGNRYSYSAYSANHSTEDYKYRDYTNNASFPWVGRGLFVFVVVVLFHCVHKPIRRVIGSPLFEVIFQFVGFVCLACGVLLTLLLAVYSVLLPLIFMCQHWSRYGFLNLEHNPLQSTLTLFYFAILAGIIGLFSRVWKFVYCDIHLFRFFNDKVSTPVKFADLVMETHNAAPIRNELIVDKFGCDIGRLLITFLPKWHITQNKDIVIAD